MSLGFVFDDVSHFAISESCGPDWCDKVRMFNKVHSALPHIGIHCTISGRCFSLDFHEMHLPVPASVPSTGTFHFGKKR